MISIKHLSFQYKEKEPVSGGISDINLEIGRGECVLLCGRSGCGKSTLLKLLNGLIPRYFDGELSGEIWIDGKRIDSYPMYELSEKVGTVFQNPRTQFFNVDVNSEIVFGMENFGRSFTHMEERRKKVLQDFDLEVLSQNSIFDLSGGEKQRVAFGSVYAGNPDCYLLDEPSSNLDEATITKLTRSIKTIQEQNKTILIAEHRLYYLMDVIDRVIYMEKGQITKDLTREEFLSLSEQERKAMGLRTREIGSVRTAIQEKASSPEKKRSDFAARDLSLFQKKDPILKGVSFTAEKGDVIGIIGRNGVGKTTLIRYLCGLHKQGNGDISLFGKSLNRKERTGSAYIVMQDVNYQLFADSVLEECSFGLSDFDKGQVESLLRKFDLWDLRMKHPNTLSGGQKQRLAVIAGIIGKRPVLIFDEPTSGLDYDSMQKVADTIQEIAKERIVFVVTHDEEFIERSCTGLADLEHFSENDRPFRKENI